MTETVRVLFTREVARIVQHDLRQQWPGVRFAVRPGPYAAPNTVLAEWTDGPAEDAVSEAVAHFEALGQGEDRRGPVRYGIHRVLIARTISPAGYDVLADALERRYPLSIPRDAEEGVDWEAAHVLTVEAPVELHGNTFGPLEGTYGRPSDTGPVSAAYALHLLAVAADLSEFDLTTDRPSRGRALLQILTRRTPRH